MLDYDNTYVSYYRNQVNKGVDDNERYITPLNQKKQNFPTFEPNIHHAGVHRIVNQSGKGIKRKTRRKQKHSKKIGFV